MLPGAVIAVFLSSILVAYLSIKFYESRGLGPGKAITGEPKEDIVHEPLLILGLIFMLVFFAETITYIIMVFFNQESILTGSVLQLRFPFDSAMQSLGMTLIVLGYVLVFWSVHVREDTRLVTSGPYRYVRHPMYTAYFAIFLGFFLTILNLIALAPLLAIPGEIHTATIEEEHLAKRYGEAYRDYKQRTGMFFPKRRKSTR
jgi:protein-S-isoprenylcysteine O-methyltransferase Ste14